MIRMKKYISLVIFLCLIVVSGVTYYKKMNLLSLPEEETVEYAEISYGISDEDPIYRITDEEKIAELFELVDMESWKKTNYVMEYSPLEYVHRINELLSAYPMESDEEIVKRIVDND